jgi:predicted nucleic acid-binding protein
LSYFFDTSALVKIYHQEEDSDEIVDIFNSRTEIFVSELSVIEYHSVIYRKFRENNLEEIERHKILKKFEIDLNRRFELLVFNPNVIDTSKKVYQIIGKELFVRSLDVIQVGFFKSYLDDSDMFMTFDSRQILAVERLKEKNFFDTITNEGD